MIVSPSQSTSSSALSSPNANSTTPSYTSTAASSLLLNTLMEDQDGEHQTCLSPYYEAGPYRQVENLEPPPSPQTGNHCTISHISHGTSHVSKLESPDLGEYAKDDTLVRLQPSKYVDYLSHNWKEEEIWSSWKHIVSKREAYSNNSRLENGLWRTWTKSKYKLQTISPQSIDWLKDCDITWLYGPLQTGLDRMPSSSPSRSNRSSKYDSFLDQKPILKRRNMSETMLQRSLSALSLVKQGAAEVKAQRFRKARRGCDQPGITRATFDSVTFPLLSVSEPPGSGKGKHIRFDEDVKHWIALDMKGNEDKDNMASRGRLGRVVDAVNTAKDIAYVIWNVGWR